MTQQESPQVIGVRHVGLSARDPASLAAFYRELLGLQVVPTDTAALGATAFLSSQPAEGSLDLALFANPALQHTAFEVRSLADLRAFHQRVLGRGVPVKMALNHGASFGKLLDLHMMVMAGGLERTEPQHRRLFAAHGFRLTRVVPTSGDISIIEGVPA